MHTTNLRRVGDVVVLTIPAEVLEELELAEDAAVGMSIDGCRLVVEPAAGARVPRYTLQELLDQCEGPFERTAEDTEWLEMKPVGRELL